VLNKILSFFHQRAPAFARATSAATRMEPILLTPASTPEHHAIAQGRGRWGDRLFPKSGWTLAGIQDLGEPHVVCGACGASRVRFVHYLTHPAFPGELAAGCVCAGYLLDDHDGVSARDRAMRSRAGKRTRWLRRRWRRSARTGNAWIRADGYTVTIYQREDRWGAVVSHDRGGTPQHLRRSYAHQDDAKLAAFDLVSSLVCGARCGAPRAVGARHQAWTAGSAASTGRSLEF
jgi:hypothetical protein